MTGTISERFIKMGDTALASPEPCPHFEPAGSSGDWVQFTVPLIMNEDPEPFPDDATAVRFIITASNRYFPAGTPVDFVFPVGQVTFPASASMTPPAWPPAFTIWARNSDTQQGGGYASFMWLAIAEGASEPNKNFSPVPLNQIFVGQPASFAATNDDGDQQFFPYFSDPAGPYTPIPGPGNVQSTAIYNFNETFSNATFTNITEEPFVFATANSYGTCLTGSPAHNAAVVPVIGFTEALAMENPYYQPQDMSVQGFQMIGRSSDTAKGLCGFSWAALKQTSVNNPGQPLLVDTGQLPGTLTQEFFFAPAGTQGDWASAEIQFSQNSAGTRPPFNIEPVVLVTARGGPDVAAAYPYVAPVAMAQNVTRFGFTLAARNSDSNPNGGAAGFDWVAFGY
jgi:hypothetical protein